MREIKTPRLIAFYLPQYHPIPENDAWWGKGFTEWTNVAKARPLFKGHYQPHIPADLGFYDLRIPEVRQAQADLAREAGVEGFCYWHYWFAGKRLLEKPFEEVLQSGKPNFPFCLAWANVTWTGIWYGAASRILIEQTYPGVADHIAHFESLLPAFLDSRYIRVDGKPLFFVLQPCDLSAEAVSLWRGLAASAGIKGLFFIGIIKNNDEGARILQNGFDGYTISKTAGRGVLRSPIKSLSIKLFGEKQASLLYQRITKKPFYIYDGQDTIPFLELQKSLDLEYYPCIMPNWDNSPRAGLDGHIWKNTTPELFRKHLKAAIQRVEMYPDDRKIVIIKSWNEWAEGNHIEPDLRFEHGFLNAIRDEMQK